MADAIRCGDHVMLIWACCPGGRRHIGWTGVVEGTCEFWDGQAYCFCGQSTTGIHAWINIDGRGAVPTAWLIRTPRRQDIYACHDEVVSHAG